MAAASSPCLIRAVSMPFRMPPRGHARLVKKQFFEHLTPEQEQQFGEILGLLQRVIDPDADPEKADR